jgi:transcription-repair coupling factor (superfamily II helicase)
MSLYKIAEKVKTGLPIAQINHKLRESQRVNLQKFVGSLPAFLTDALSRNYHQIVILTADEERARSLYSDLESLGTKRVFYLPATAERAYEKQQITDISVLVQRSEILENITRDKTAVVIASAKAIFEKVSPPELFMESSILLKRNQAIDPEVLRDQLVTQGYSTVSFVDAPGEMAYRGGILDVFPYSGTYPVRIEFFGNEIDSIREFDPSSQRSVAFLDETRLVPDVSGIGSSEKLNLLSYLDKEALIEIVNPSMFMAELEDLNSKAVTAFEKSPRLNTEAPSALYVSASEFENAIAPFKLIMLGGAGSDNQSIQVNALPQPDFNSSIKLLKKNISDLSNKGCDCLILCDNEGQRERFEELLGDRNDAMRYEATIHSLHEGFILEDIGLAVYTDHQVFNRYHRPRLKQKKVRGGFSLKEIKDLKKGDFVVHVDYGIGQFEGFTNITVRGNQQEAVVVRYANDSILYVNVSSLHKLQKYTGKDGAVPRVTKLGSGEWARKKAKTRSQVKDIARDLIQLYAKRKAQRAFAFSEDGSMQVELEASFEFEETPDQFRAIEDVKRDMMSDMPMDRLVCGDVGFGKTEVAVRAAFKAVSDGKQVAVLVPTTILADQHAKTFKRRMNEMPVNIEVISRFRSAGEIKEILKKTAEGKVDILIGTHRVTSKDVRFKDLGLLIIDEEQRFGVSTKEKLKEFRASVDVLTLTATPIPRTLQFSLMGARDLSVINTPPPNRQPVYTEIHTFDTAMIRDAILQEISRNGQVFFIHNRVSNIEEISGLIRKILPNVRVRFAHGQMKGPELEKIIVDFYAHKFDVLVSTNIVENGIDISNANTIIINRADHFGLSELHQLRGRVGRSNRKAFCYLVTPPLSDLSIESRKRLMALVEFSDLGSGFNIAMRDLDIRGAGDMLGASQSGFINEIGFELYSKILNDAVRELKETEFAGLFDSEPTSTELPETSIEFDLTAVLDKHYVQDDIERLNLYRRLSQASETKEIDEWVEELTDRFGKMNKHARNLVVASRIRLAASRCYLHKVIIRAGKMWLECPNPKSDQGGSFFEKGLFQALLKRVELVYGTNYKITQKDDVVRIVLDNIIDVFAALDMLNKIAGLSSDDEHQTKIYSDTSV